METGPSYRHEENTDLAPTLIQNYVDHGEDGGGQREERILVNTVAESM